MEVHYLLLLEAAENNVPPASHCVKVSYLIGNSMKQILFSEAINEHALPLM